MSPRVSIITPMHDAAPYLEEAIESARRQTFQDWELILVDDASTDSSASIAMSAARADDRIRLMGARSPHAQGAAAARNRGLQDARGEFVAFLDADDVFEPDRLQVQITALAEHPEAALVYGPTRWWHPHEPQRDWVEPMDAEAGRVHPPPTLLSRIVLLQQGHVPCVCAVLVRRAALQVVGGFEERFALYEDQTLWVKLFARFPVFVSAICAARYRQHAASASARAESRGEYRRRHVHSSRIPFLEWVCTYTAEAGIADPQLQRAIRIAGANYGAPPSLQRTLDRGYIKAHAILRRFRFRSLRRVLSGIVPS